MAGLVIIDIKPPCTGGFFCVLTKVRQYLLQMCFYSDFRCQNRAFTVIRNENTCFLLLISLSIGI